MEENYCVMPQVFIDNYCAWESTEFVGKMLRNTLSQLKLSSKRLAMHLFGKGALNSLYNK